MKIFISTDIEGIGCVVRSEHSAVTGREYPEARRWMTMEVNAAARAAFEAGADEVVITDGHNVGLNLLCEQLDERAVLIAGTPRPLSMMEGIDCRFDAAFLVGYHAMAGTTDGTITHIFHGRIAEVAINGTVMGEIGISALLAGFFSVPVVLVTGDEACAAEARHLLGNVETAVVKRGIGAYAAACQHPKRCREIIYQAATRALSRLQDFTPFDVGRPAQLTVRFTTASGADRALRMPGTQRTGGCTVEWQGENAMEAFKAFNTMADLAELVPFI